MAKKITLDNTTIKISKSKNGKVLAINDSDENVSIATKGGSIIATDIEDFSIGVIENTENIEKNNNNWKNKINNFIDYPLVKLFGFFIGVFSAIRLYEYFFNH